LLQCVEQGPMLVGCGQQFEVNDQLHKSSLEDRLGQDNQYLSEKEGGASSPRIHAGVSAPRFR
jgi:hypothetical protein